MCFRIGLVHRDKLSNITVGGFQEVALEGTAVTMKVEL
jgi:hypothetical protein